MAELDWKMGAGVGCKGSEGQVVMAGAPEAASVFVCRATSEGVTFCLQTRMMSTGQARTRGGGDVFLLDRFSANKTTLPLQPQTC